MIRQPYGKGAPIGSDSNTGRGDHDRTGATIERNDRPGRSKKSDGPEVLVYVTRPDGTPIWIPKNIALELRVRRGARLTRDQYDGCTIQDLLMARREKETKKRACNPSDD